MLLLVTILGCSLVIGDEILTPSISGKLYRLPSDVTTVQLSSHITGLKLPIVSIGLWIVRLMSQPILKDWMNENDKLGSVYRQGVSDFILFASGKDETSTTCPCPCNKCRNRKRFAYDIVRKHLIHNGIESTYRVWDLHGENPYKDQMVNRVEEENSEEGLGIGNFVDVAYGMHEELVGDLTEAMEVKPRC
ncbi:hypothetical protein IFM89_028229 [Coptis chinensis]|uniref:Transposase-associated domain-containing protein n=1 Tax=Coptis chinensis TaxID=261450 RepID=A0A835MFF1_9MAGN|nr:hypothetical protein IFM89_028229 [Coptis chinensis]